jgi:hypothetical protein
LKEPRGQHRPETKGQYRIMPLAKAKGSRRGLRERETLWGSLSAAARQLPLDGAFHGTS